MFICLLPLRIDDSWKREKLGLFQTYGALKKTGAQPMSILYFYLDNNIPMFISKTEVKKIIYCNFLGASLFSSLN